MSILFYTFSIVMISLISFFFLFELSTTYIILFLKIVICMRTRAKKSMRQRITIPKSKLKFRVSLVLRKNVKKYEFFIFDFKVKNHNKN